MSLIVKRLHPDALLPTCANAGEDLGFDIFALEGTRIQGPTKVRTGISARFHRLFDNYGLLVRDRSSMASKGIWITGGVIDAGYTGEISVILNSIQESWVEKGDKIAQLIPIEVLTATEVIEVNELPSSQRREGAFGSTGK